MPFMPSLVASEAFLHELPGYLSTAPLWLLRPQSLDHPLLELAVRRQFLKYRSLERRVVVEMFGQEPSKLSIPVRSLSELMEHLVHKVLILRAPCHQLLPQGVISQDPIHHRRIRRHRMRTGRESERYTHPQPSRQAPHAVLLGPYPIKRLCGVIY